MQPAPLRELFSLNRPIEDLRPEYQDAVIAALRTLWRRKLMIFGISAACVFVALVAASFAEKTYVGEALVQLKFDGAGSTAPGAANHAIAVDAAAVVEGEAEIIRSGLVARRVADRYPFDNARVNAAETAAGAGLGSQDGSPSDRMALRWNGLWEGLIKTVRGEPLPNADRNILRLQRNLTVRNDAKSYLIRIIYHANSPERAAQLANAFAEEYLALRVQLSLDNARRTSEWYAAQVVEAEADYFRLTGEVGAFRERTGVITAESGSAQAMEQQLRDIVGQLSNARLDQLRQEERLERIRDAVARGSTPSSLDMQGSATIQRLIDAELQARQDVDRLASQVGDKHPVYERANTALAVARMRLEEAVNNSLQLVESDVASARESVARLEAQQDLFKQASISSQTDAKELSRLEANTEAARVVLGQLRTNLRDARAMMDLKSVAAQLVSAAEPLAVAESPRMSLILMLAGMGGLAISLLGVGALELRDTGFRSGEQVAAKLGLTCIGMLPRRNRRPTAADRKSHQRCLTSIAIFAGLRTVAQPTASRMIVVTSSLPDEGTASLACGLASTLSVMGHKVLLVERTVPSPRGGHPATGDSTADLCVVSAWDDRIAEAVQPGAGNCPPSDHYCRLGVRNLAAFIDRQDQAKPWFDEQGSQFDVVIIQAPPLLTDPEALTLMQPAQTVVLATRWNATPRTAVNAAVAQLSRLNQIVPLVVLTDVDIKKHKSFGGKDNLYYIDRCKNA